MISFDFPMEINASLSSDPLIYKKLAFDVSVKGFPSIKSNSQPTIKIIEKGDSSEFRIEVTNYLGEAERYTFSLLNPLLLYGGWSVSINPSSVEIQSLETREIIITVNTPPNIPGTKRLLFKLIAESSNSSYGPHILAPEFCAIVADDYNLVTNTSSIAYGKVGNVTEVSDIISNDCGIMDIVNFCIIEAPLDWSFTFKIETILTNRYYVKPNEIIDYQLFITPSPDTINGDYYVKIRLNDRMSSLVISIKVIMESPEIELTETHIKIIEMPKH